MQTRDRSLDLRGVSWGLRKSHDRPLWAESDRNVEKGGKRTLSIVHGYPGSGHETEVFILYDDIVDATSIQGHPPIGNNADQTT
jgi:hypothetical protein